MFRKFLRSSETTPIVNGDAGPRAYQPHEVRLATIAGGVGDHDVFRVNAHLLDPGSHVIQGLSAQIRRLHNGVSRESFGTVSVDAQYPAAPKDAQGNSVPRAGLDRLLQLTAILAEQPEEDGGFDATSGDYLAHALVHAEGAHYTVHNAVDFGNVRDMTGYIQYRPRAGAHHISEFHVSPGEGLSGHGVEPTRDYAKVAAGLLRTVLTDQSHDLPVTIGAEGALLAAPFDAQEFFTTNGFAKLDIAEGSSLFTARSSAQVQESLTAYMDPLTVMRHPQ